MKKLFLLLALFGMVAVGCSKDDTDKGNDNKTEQPNENEGGNDEDIPENIFFGLDKESVTISPDGGSVDVIVYSNYKWEISGTSDWCTPSVKDGDANEDGQKVTFSADVAYDDRETTFWFRCADEKIKFVVSQRLKEVIIPDANNTFNIPAEGGVAVISYQTTVDCDVIIPEEAQDWITIAPATRGLVSENINLDISENTTYSARTAVIKVVAKDNAELAVEYTINQEQNDAILSDENNTFTVPSAGGEVVINCQTNIDCEVIIPDEAQDWITIAPATRGLVSESITLNVAVNTTYSARTAVIKVVAKDNAELAVEYTINQEQNDAVLANGNTEFTIDGREQQITIEHKANVDCDVVIPDEAQDWVAIAPATRGLSTYSTTLNIAENNSGKERSCVVKVASQGDNELSAEYIIIQKPRYCLYYTSNDGKIVQPYRSSSFGATILSNTYKDGVGVIDFNNPITTIGYEAFYDCESLTSVTIPDSVTTIGNDAFYNCSSLTSVTIPNSVTAIGNYAFAWCSSLTSVTIGNSVTTIGDAAFLYCTSLTSVTIGDSVTTIGSNAFDDCYSLQEFNGKLASEDGRCLILNGVIYAFARYGITEYTIPDSVTTIGDYAFKYCESLTSVTIGDSVTTIGWSAFCDCSSLTSVTIGDSVTTIGSLAFCGCSSLTSVTIPDSVTTIGEYAFYGCTGELIIYSKIIETDYSYDNRPTNDGWLSGAKFTKLTIGDSIEKIGYAAFGECSSLTSVTIGDSVTTIGDLAFCWCESLTSVTIGDSVTTIGEGTFAYCESLTSVTIPDSVTTIGECAFEYCSSLTSVTIGDSVTTIGESAFKDCSSLTSVTIPDSVTTIGYYAFFSCSSLTSVYCKATTPPAGGSFMFYDNASGRKIYVPMESVNKYKSASGWSDYKSYIVGYNF